MSEIKKCEFCSKEGKIKQTPSMTSYSYDPFCKKHTDCLENQELAAACKSEEDPDPNQDLYLCCDCSEDYLTEMKCQLDWYYSHLI